MIKQNTHKTPAVFVPAITHRPLITRVLVLSSAAFSAPFANAAIDISPITDLITQAVTAATAIGIGFLAFTAGMAIYRKLRGAT